MAVQLKNIFQQSGVTSLKSLAALTGSPEKSAYRQGQIAAIDLCYRSKGGLRGILGYPMGEVEFNGANAIRSYAAGDISFLAADELPNITSPIYNVELRFLGFHCDQESNWDQATGSDEPYFIIGLSATNGTKTVKFGPYEDVDSGTVRFEGAIVDQDLVPPVFLGVKGLEHDWGTPEEAVDKVRDAMKAVEKELDQAAAAFLGASADSHVMPEWLRKIVIGWVPEFVAPVFGLGDDDIGQNSRWFFDYKRGPGTPTQYPIAGQFGNNEYTHTLKIDGGDQGIYTLYFFVRLWEKVPAPDA